MEQRERIEQLKTGVQRLGGDHAVMFGVDHLPPDVAEEFLKRVIAFEKSEEAQEEETQTKLASDRYSVASEEITPVVRGLPSATATIEGSARCCVNVVGIRENRPDQPLHGLASCGNRPVRPIRGAKAASLMSQLRKSSTHTSSRPHFPPKLKSDFCPRT